MKKIIKFFIDNAKVFNTIAVALILSGVYLYFFGKKEGFPSVKFDQIYINTIYPGASADEVERIVTRKIEEEIKRVNGAKRVTSQSIENLSTVVFEVEADASKNFQKVLNDVKTAVDRVTDLPAEVKKSDVFELDFDLFPAISVLVVGDKEENLQLAVRQIEDDLKNIKGVGKVNRVGYRDREIWVEADPDKLKAYQLGMSDVITAIRLRNVSLPGGKLQMSGREYFVRTRGQFQNIEEISETVVRANLDGRIVRVKDLANVRWDFEEATQVTRAVGTLGIRLNVLKKKSGDIINVADAVKAKINHYNDKKLLPGSVRLFYADDQSFFVKRRLHVLQDNATIGLILVVLCLILFFDGVTTFWATAGVPIVFATALLYLNLFGYTLNLMSMFGFIIVIGFLVDDAVVVAENIFRHREMGKDPMNATLDGAAEVFQPVQATTLTTIIAFSSLLMLPGIFGKFLSIVSVVVTVTMLLSLLETFGFLPGRLVYSLQALHGTKEQNRKGMRRLLYEGLLKNFFTRMGEWYRSFVKVLMYGPVWAPLGAWLKRRLSVFGSLVNTAGRILRLVFAALAPVLVGVPAFLLANFLRLFSKRFFKDAEGESLKGRITRYRTYFNLEYDRALWPAWTLILVTVFNIALLVVGFTFVKKEFFPGATDEYVVKIELPVSSPLEET
ncbi:MAG: efflux RND transporter permease subunit, partial [Spirochaetia bacterium]|nr:efflux RND transporter permease subunit [Spirochaetia bacterium]